MEKACPKCNEKLVKGVAHRLTSGDFSVRFDKTETFEKLNKPILSPYVCKKCGFIEWFVDRTDLL